MHILRATLSYLWKALNTTRKLLLNLLFFILLGLCLTYLLSGPNYEEVPENGFLVLNPKGYLVEQKSHTPFIEQLRNNSLGGQNEVSEIELYDLIAAIDYAMHDERVQGIVLDLAYFRGGGLSKLEQVGDKLAEYREVTSKPIYAFGDYFTQSQYLLAAHASEVILDPAGSVNIQGFYTYQSYIAGLLERLSIQAHIFKAGDYKTAVEPFARSNMSPEAREATQSWLSELWQHYVDTLGQHRVLDPRIASGRLADYLSIYEEVGFKESELALRAGLVDTLSSREQFDQKLRIEPDSNISKISYDSYIQTRRNEIEVVNHELPEIRVVHISGEIYYGRSDYSGNTGSYDAIRALHDAKEDENVKAILLRIDSPGGSAFASELIRQAVNAIREQGIPIFASFGSTAASGGYWVGLGAEKIYAAPTTLTGSIGVFGIVLTVQDALSNIGIESDGVATTEFPVIDNFQTLSQSAELLLQTNVNKTYEQFVTLVAEAREMSYEEAEFVANGRVWTGQQAEARGLVDGVGDISFAIAELAEHAALESYVVERPRSTPSKLSQFVRGIFVQSFELFTPHHVQNQSAVVPRLMNELKHIEMYNDPHAIYARCYSCQEIPAQ